MLAPHHWFQWQQATLTGLPTSFPLHLTTYTSSSRVQWHGIQQLLHWSSPLPPVAQSCTATDSFAMAHYISPALPVAASCNATTSRESCIEAHHCLQGQQAELSGFLFPFPLQLPTPSSDDKLQCSDFQHLSHGTSPLPPVAASCTSTSSSLPTLLVTTSSSGSKLQCHKLQFLTLWS